MMDYFSYEVGARVVLFLFNLGFIYKLLEFKKVPLNEVTVLGFVIAVAFVGDTLLLNMLYGFSVISVLGLCLYLHDYEALPQNPAYRFSIDVYGTLFMGGMLLWVLTFFARE